MFPKLNLESAYIEVAVLDHLSFRIEGWQSVEQFGCRLARVQFARKEVIVNDLKGHGRSTIDKCNSVSRQAFFTVALGEIVEDILTGYGFKYIQKWGIQWLWCDTVDDWVTVTLSGACSSAMNS